MVRPGLAAAAEERQRKLQEYLAAKGKLKCPDSKPYLKAKSNCPNPPPSKSTVRPKKDVTNHAALPVKAARPISSQLHPRPANNPGSQEPQLEPPKRLGERLTSEHVSSNPNGEPSIRSQQQHKAGSSTRELSGKTAGSLNTQELKAAKPQATDAGNGARADSVDKARGGGESLHGCPKHTNKENLPYTSLHSEKKPQPGSWARSEPETSSYHQTKSSLAPKQALARSSLNSAVLKDRANEQLVRGTRARIPPGKSQQLSRGAGLARPGGKAPKTVPSHCVQTLSRTQASRKPGFKDPKDTKVTKSKYERPSGAKIPSHAVAEQRAEHSRPRTGPGLLRGVTDSRHPCVGQDRKPPQPPSGPQAPCVPHRSNVISQRPDLAPGSFTSVTARAPSSRADAASVNKHSSCPQKVRTLHPQWKGAIPQNHCLYKTAPKTHAGGTAAHRTGVPRGTQTSPGAKRKTTAEDRRKQLEEWQKSKGKMYKRPMELKTKRKITEEMNISFWKRMEKEEEEQKAQLELSSKISSTLTECLQLIEGGVLSNEVFTILSSIPEAEKFAKFWICKAKFLASKGTFDVIGLYEEAIRNGATPIQELREVVLNILQDPTRATDGTTSGSSAAETSRTSIQELAGEMEPAKSCLSPKGREQALATPQKPKAEQGCHSGIKLQVAPIPRVSGMPEVQDLKLVTPVRRSARIERVASHYPELLREHDMVVASLDELLEVEDTEFFVFRRNEALPVTLGFQSLKS
ncbi:PREDICTED: cytoskeleton-associated protein 2-like isoform X1 [Hipposideros armiger]|uniref:Cytoskeleton-associated protein 2-like isoform X1 n=2 Tax=Hipposideros armiger TaxID=186990 RepID=A0A8B7SYF4_HIPAR|nr:PREDICTED: cytoskeleton-associated protein 2-like isoform X1 [Hipposideros armiger]